MNDHLFKERYFPRWADLEKYAGNAYAKTREECKDEQKTPIVEMKKGITELETVKHANSASQ